MADAPANSAPQGKRRPPVGKPFQKGVSGNPTGRPKALAEIVELARQHAPAAIQTLARIAADQEAPHAAQVAASNSLLDRGFGKPAQAVEHSGEDKGPIQIVYRWAEETEG